MCNCIEEVNKALVDKGMNTELEIPISFSPKGLYANRVLIATKKADKNKREKPIHVTPSFCPFCGEEYEG